MPALSKIRIATFCSLLVVTHVPMMVGASAQRKPSEKPQVSVSAAAVDGKKLLNGYRRYHGTCSHCHGPGGVGSSFAPSLVERLLPYADFKKIVEQGSRSGTAVMRGFGNDPNVARHIDDIYAYLLARLTGRIGRGRPTF